MCKGKQGVKLPNTIRSRKQGLYMATKIDPSNSQAPNKQKDIIWTCHGKSRVAAGSDIDFNYLKACILLIYVCIEIVIVI